MSVNFPNLQKIYNDQMDLLLSATGLTTKCFLNYGVTKRNICPNCIYDNNLKKSSGVYRSGGPRPFVSGRICPYCNGIGYYGETQGEEVFLAVIANHKDWIIKPTNIENAKNMIQTICSKENFSKFKRCRDMTVVYSETNSNPVYRLAEDPTPAGLGDHNYLITNWEKTTVSTPSSSMVS